MKPDYIKNVAVKLKEPFWEVTHILQDRMYGDIFFLDL
jgi:hypothetical protein